ncbi:pyridoxamine 5'-phosphate oxidase family protein [Allonocardiopsis opalescens]|uniref:PPOX class probable F420-dependent enzyme n=1 Tax=Allonocardiopsis opalescens TaxID=1144618 RepID=A0A2T0PTR8_9ACTN|nr:pyridoxamine 5'-phosphate oxidase family protein [Allonocardiopsis opalescens]PRX92293.1 PPOX class probable F420-dependent enzyme [Allonocardiopsis opalescens]
MSKPMSERERQEFLAGTHIGVLAVTRGGRSAPLAVPVWYDYRPGGDVLVVTGAGSMKERLVRAAGSFSLCVQVEEPPYKYVSVEGPVVATHARPTREEVLSMARRYLGEEEAAAYADGDHSGDVLLRMRPRRWLSADFAADFAEAGAAAEPAPEG